MTAERFAKAMIDVHFQRAMLIEQCVGYNQFSSPRLISANRFVQDMGNERGKVCRPLGDVERVWVMWLVNA